MVNLQDSNLRTFALVAAQLTTGRATPTDYLLPYFRTIISRHAGNPYVPNDILAEIKSEFQIGIPFYLAEQMTKKLKEIGALKEDNSLGFLVCKTSDDALDSHGSLEADHFEELAKKLNGYATKMGVSSPSESKNWESALFSFFSGESESIDIDHWQADDGVGRESPQDAWIISHFIRQVELLEPSIFEVVKKIYAAYAITEAICEFQNTGHEQHWQGLSVFYDSTVLMRLLGTSGVHLRQATLEMHNMLLEIGCRTYYFNHNLEEVLSNLDYLAKQYRQGKDIHKETAYALERGETTMAHIHMMLGAADTMLAEIGISEHLIKNKSRLKSAAFQVNPLEIESYLKRVLPYRANSNAPKADADTLERILLLRKGNLGRSIPESKAIFVTHNWNYSTLSRKYCVDHLDYSWQTAPPITTLGVLTRLAWLGSANSKDPMVLSKDLAAKSYQAALPDKRWLNKFWQTLEKSNPELIDQNCSDSLYLLDVRERAENITMGNSSLIGKLEIPEILQDLRN
jgi:hypothetical protein